MPLFPSPHPSQANMAPPSNTFSRGRWSSTFRGSGRGNPSGNHHPYHQLQRPPQQDANYRSSGISGTSTSTSTAKPTMVRQHQQNVAVVSVPEANQFFVTPVADRLALLGKLQLHSLLEYIDQLEAYRQAGLNRLKIAAFNRQYYAVLLGKASASSSSSSLKVSKADKEQTSLATEDAEGAKLTGQAGVLLGQLEAKLETLQLKRMMEATVNSFGGGGGRSSITSNSLSDLFNLQQPDYLQQLQIDSNEGSGGVESEEVKHLPPNQEEQKQEDEEEEEEELVEVIDLTRLVDELVADGDAGKPKEKQVKQETPIWANWSATLATKEASSTADAAAAEDEKLIEMLQAKVRLLEAELAAQKKEEEEDSKKHRFATPTKASSTLRHFNSPKSDEVPFVGGKLCLGGHQLPLPAAYNRLALVEKSLLLAPLGEALRGHYLNLCWQEAIAGKLAKKAFFSGAAT